VAVGGFACTSVDFTGTAIVDHADGWRAAVSGNEIVPEPATARLAASFAGRATLANPAAGAVRQHDFWVDIAITGPASGRCAEGTPSRYEFTNTPRQSFDMAASAGCPIPRLAIDPDSRVTQSGALISFEAVVTSRFDFDSGHEGSRCCSQRGGTLTVLVRTRFRFEAGKGDPPNQQKTSGIPDPDFVLDDRDEHFIVREGPGLNTGCRYNTAGRLEIRLPVTRYIGQTNADGTLQAPFALIARDVVGTIARLRLAVWDVDDKAPVSGSRKPEIDKITFNGQPVFDASNQDWLTGSDKLWTVNEFAVPIEYVKFPAQPGAFPDGAPTPALNVITIDIDSQNNAEWCTEASWASLSLSAMAPWMLVHGTNAQHDTWELAVAGNGIRQSPVDALRERRIPFEHRIDLEANGSFDDNAALLHGHILRHARRFGADRVHIVAHSKGASDARRMLARHGSRLRYVDGSTVRVLSLFAIGTPSRGTSISDLAVAVDNAFWAFDLTLIPAGAQAQLGAGFGQTPVDPARRLQTSRSMDGPGGFNDTTPKAPDVPYYSIAGDADRNGSQSIDLGEEIEEFLPSTVLTWPGDYLYQVLGRYQEIDFVTLPNGPRVLTSTATASFQANDLVSTTASVHCARCGFTPLSTLRLNHTTLKCREVMFHISDVIGFLYPVEKGGR
jgi:hypothetical protein